MSNIEHGFNFNEPVEIEEIFRTFENIEEETEEGPKHSARLTEYGSKTSFGWEDIKMIRTNAYPDDWESFKGDKVRITLHNYPNEILALGSYQELRDRWCEFRLRYPMFVDQEGEDDTNEN